MRYLVIFLIIILPVFSSAKSLALEFSSLTKNQNLKASKQSMCIEDSGGVSIAEQNKQLRVIPASVSKIYVLDWAITTLPEDFRFTTSFILNGDVLYINGGGDPQFVTEHLIETISKFNNEQNILINKIVFSPDFYFNWNNDPEKIKKELINVLKNQKPTNVNPNVTVVQSLKDYNGKGTLIEFESIPLTATLKNINNYSTNISADILFERLGGSKSFSKYMKNVYGANIKTVKFKTGSGLSGNYTTCGLTLKVIKHLESKLKEDNLSLTDVMSVPMVDPGVMQNRTFNVPQIQSVVAKSGFVNHHHTLAGAINTQDDVLYFGVFTNYDDLKSGLKVRLMVDSYINQVLEEYNKTLLSFNYKPDMNLLEQYKIIKK
jgi:D-alanyl-D-alanine carboxypeptidase